MAATDDLTVLANVILAARSELLDRDPEDIPKKLSRAASATGRRIPPPYQRSILAHIEADDGFRDAVRDAFVAGDFDDPLGLEYLDDPIAAAPKVDLAVAVGVIAELRADLEAEKLKTEKVHEKLAVSLARYDSAQKGSSRKLADRTEADKRARSGLEKTAREAEARADTAAEAVDVLQRELKERDTEIAELETRIAKLNEKLAKRKPSPSMSGDVQRSATPSDPVKIAMDLDTQERRMRTYRKAHLGSGVPPGDMAPIAVPHGLSPSDATVVDAVVRQVPDRVIIDGYNVSGLVHPEQFSTRAARDDVINRAAKLVRETEAEIIVVFDAQHSTEGTSTFTSAAGVEVVFEGDTSADDTIAVMVHAESDRCIVITNDREIHNRVRRDGCVSIFSTAFVSWTEHLNRS